MQVHNRFSVSVLCKNHYNNKTLIFANNSNNKNIFLSFTKEILYNSNIRHCRSDRQNSLLNITDNKDNSKYS